MPYEEDKDMTTTTAAVTLLVAHTIDQASAVDLLAAWYVDVGYQSLAPLSPSEVRDALVTQIQGAGLPDRVWRERHDLAVAEAERITEWAEAQINAAWPQAGAWL